MMNPSPRSSKREGVVDEIGSSSTMAWWWLWWNFSRALPSDCEREREREEEERKGQRPGLGSADPMPSPLFI
jgi:hypothetical protein